MVVRFQKNKAWPTDPATPLFGCWCFQGVKKRGWGWGGGGEMGWVECGVCFRPNWYSQCSARRPSWLWPWANTLLLVCPHLIVWLCSPVTSLASLFLTLAWFDLRFGYVLWF